MRLRDSRQDDFEFYYNLKCESSSIYWSGFAKAPERDNLENHFSKLMRGETVRKLGHETPCAQPIG